MPNRMPPYRKFTFLTIALGLNSTLNSPLPSQDLRILIILIQYFRYASLELDVIQMVVQLPLGTISCYQPQQPLSLLPTTQINSSKVALSKIRILPLQASHLQHPRDMTSAEAVNEDTSQLPRTKVLFKTNFMSTILPLPSLITSIWQTIITLFPSFGIRISSNFPLSEFA